MNWNRSVAPYEANRRFDTRPLSILCLLLTALLSTHVDAQTAGRLGRANAWAARSSTGLTLGGTWTATEDAKTGSVTGSWTLLDARGRVTANGAWSAAKSPTGWQGSWRAIATGRSGEFAGTWTASVDLKPTTRFADLFAKAVEAAVSGTFRAGPQSGAWTIQAFK